MRADNMRTRIIHFKMKTGRILDQGVCVFPTNALSFIWSSYISVRDNATSTAGSQQPFEGKGIFGYAEFLCLGCLQTEMWMSFSPHAWKGF